MTYGEKRRLEMLARVCNFGVAHRPLFPDTTSASAAFAAIAAELPQLEALDVAERVASHSARTSRKNDTRKQLLEWLTRAKITAEALVKTIPQLAAHVDFPEAMDDRLLLTVARQFQEAIRPYAEPFAANGITIAQLAGLIEPFALALDERGLRQTEKEDARARILPSMARALEALKTLDLTMPNHLAGDPATLALWKRVRRVNWQKSKKDAAKKEANAAPVEAVSEEGTKAA